MKFIIGEAKKTYGLTVPAQAIAKPLAAFAAADNDDDNDDDDAQAQAAAAQRRTGASSSSTSMNRIAAAHTAEALAQDASVFEYDGVFDELKAKQKQATRAARKDAAREPKYIKQLLAKAEERKRDDELYYEKKLLREQADAAEFGTTDKFVTSAYRQKMEENRLWREQKERRDADIEARSIAASGSTALLANILNNRLADQDDDDDDDEHANVPALPQKRPAVDVPPSDANASTSDATHAAPPPPPPVVERRATQGWSADVVPEKPLLERQKEALVVETRHDESSVMSAKDRYLARKRQRTAEQQQQPPP